MSFDKKIPQALVAIESGWVRRFLVAADDYDSNLLLEKIKWVKENTQQQMVILGNSVWFQSNADAAWYDLRWG